MSMKNRLFIAAGVAAVGMLGASAYYHVRNRERDRRASSFLKLIRETLVAGDLGSLSLTAFNPDYLQALKEKGKGPIATLPRSTAHKKAQTIKDALNWYNDDEGVIYGVFDSLNSKVKVSQVADAFLSDHSTSLLHALLSSLSEDEFKIVKDKIKKRKDY